MNLSWPVFSKYFQLRGGSCAGEIFPSQISARELRTPLITVLWNTSHAKRRLANLGRELVSGGGALLFVEPRRAWGSPHITILSSAVLTSDKLVHPHVQW